MFTRAASTLFKAVCYTGAIATTIGFGKKLQLDGYNKQRKEAIDEIANNQLKQISATSEELPQLVQHGLEKRELYRQTDKKMKESVFPLFYELFGHSFHSELRSMIAQSNLPLSDKIGFLFAPMYWNSEKEFQGFDQDKQNPIIAAHMHRNSLEMIKNLKNLIEARMIFKCVGDTKNLPSEHESVFLDESFEAIQKHAKVLNNTLSQIIDIEQNISDYLNEGCFGQSSLSASCLEKNNIINVDIEEAKMRLQSNRDYLHREELAIEKDLQNAETNLNALKEWSKKIQIQPERVEDILKDIVQSGGKDAAREVAEEVCLGFDNMIKTYEMINTADPSRVPSRIDERA